MKKVVFMGGKEIGYHCLRYLLEKQKELDAEVVAAFASGRMLFGGVQDIEGLCRENSVPYLPSLDDYLGLVEVDVLISVQYHQILKRKHIRKARQIAVNLHMAPLPEYRGCNQFSFAILDGAKEFGTTIHRLEEGVDNGAILFEDRFPIPPESFVKDLYEMTYEASFRLFKNHLKDVLDGNYNPVSQEAYLGKRSTSYHLRKEIETIKQIDADWDAERKKRYFRATYFPPIGTPYMIMGGEKKELDFEWYTSL